MVGGWWLVVVVVVVLLVVILVVMTFKKIGLPVVTPLSAWR